MVIVFLFLFLKDHNSILGHASNLMSFNTWPSGTAITVTMCENHTYPDPCVDAPAAALQLLSKASPDGVIPWHLLFQEAPS